MSAVLVDNTMVMSAARLVTVDYDHPDLRRFPDLPGILLTHDLFALASLCESVVLCDEIYVHADFVGIWDKSEQVAPLLEETLIGLKFPTDLMDLAAKGLRDLDTKLDAEGVAQRAARIVYDDNHCGSPVFERKTAARLFLDQDGKLESEPSRRLLAGTAFYLLASQLLGIPYRPSALRTDLLARQIGSALAPIEMADPREILEQVMEQGRESALSEMVESVRRYFDHALAFNALRITLPNIFMAILGTCNQPSEILPRAFELRDHAGAAELRSTLGQLSWELRTGEIPKAAGFLNSVRRITDTVNEELGLMDQPRVQVGLQFGPVSLGPLFSVPKLIGGLPRHGRQMIFVREQYGRALRARTAREQVQAMFLDRLPTWFTALLRTRTPAW